MKATSFKFDSKTTALLDELKQENHAASRTEVIRKALRLLEVASDAKKNKGHLIIKDEDGNEKEILLW